MNSTMSPSIRHELRNHLNNISVNAELVKLLINDQGRKARLEKCIDTVLQECRICSELINADRDQQRNS